MFLDGGDIALGAKILGFSAAGSVGFLLVAFTIYRTMRWLMIYVFWERSRRKFKKALKADAEGGAGAKTVDQVLTQKVRSRVVGVISMAGKVLSFLGPVSRLSRLCKLCAKSVYLA